MTTHLIGGIPLLVLIIGTLFTKRIIEPACVSSIIAALLLYRFDFVNGYIEKMYQVLTDPSFQLLIIVGIGFTGLSALLDKSGTLLGFRNLIEKHCKNQRSTLFLSWLLGGIIFIDDYLNALAVSTCMKGISDKMRIPREHLAYTINCMGACVCVLLPFSSWSAFAIGTAAPFGFTLEDYIKSIPMMFYPICAIVISLLLIFNKIPKIGELKKAYERVSKGGPLLIISSDTKTASDTEGQQKASSPVYFLLVMIVLILGMLLFNKNIVAGILFAVITIVIICKVKKLSGIHDSVDAFLEGSSAMTPMLISIYFTFIMQSCSAEMGFVDFLTEQMRRTFPAPLLPVAAFMLVSIITFFAASFWTLIVISVPIFLPAAAAMGVPLSLILASIMSGVALGSQACLYSDAIFMVAAGTDVSNETQFRVVFPYVIIGAIPAAILFTIAGYIIY